MNDAQLEQRLKNRIAFAARAYLFRTQEKPLTEAEAFAKARKNVLDNHYYCASAESRRQLFHDKPWEESVESLYFFQKQCVYEQEVIARGIKAGIFDEKLDIMSLAHNSLKEPVVLNTRMLKTIKDQVRREQIAIEIGWRNNHLPAHSTIDTVAPAKKEEAIQLLYGGTDASLYLPPQ